MIVRALFLLIALSFFSLLQVSNAYFVDPQGEQYKLDGNFIFSSYGAGNYFSIGNSKILYVTSNNVDDNRIMKLDPTGKISLTWTSPNWLAFGDITVSPDGYIYALLTNKFIKFNEVTGPQNGGTQYKNDQSLYYHHIAANKLGYFFCDKNISVAKYNGSTGVRLVTSYGGGNSYGGGDFKDVSDIAIDSHDNIYVADHQGHCVYKYTYIEFVYNKPGQIIIHGPTSQIKDPYGIEIDANNNIYVLDADGSSMAIRKFDYQGNWKAAIRQLDGVDQMKVAPNGEIYIGNRNTGRIEKFSVISYKQQIPPQRLLQKKIFSK